MNGQGIYKEVYIGTQEIHEGDRERRKSGRPRPLKSTTKAHNNKVLLQKELRSF